MPRRPSSEKRNTRRLERAALRQLSVVRSQRKPYARLLRTLVADTLDHHLPETGLIVEIGTGDGQLRERLPTQLLPRLVHTEPSAEARRVFQTRYPGAPMSHGSAEALPFGDGEVAAVVGLCVLDVVEDGPAVAREVARVLRPGGRFIHWLDMSTKPNAVFASLAGTELIPLPNVFGDPSAAKWPEDLFLVARADLDLVVAILRARHELLARPIAQYLSFFSDTSQPKKAVSEFIQLQENAAVRSELGHVFRLAYQLAPPALKPRLRRFEGRPVSSARHFEGRLKSWFNEATGFTVERSDISATWECIGRHSAATRAAIYRSMCVGEQRASSSVPDTLLCKCATWSTADEILLELGAFVFVASRS